MNTPVFYEILGYAASILIAISLTMSSILRLRVINLVGALIFTIYGFFIQSYPVAGVNFFIVLVDLYYLYQMRSGGEFFRLLPVASTSEYLRSFLNFYRQDILRFQPGLTVDPDEKHLAFFVLRNMIPAGLVIGEMRGSNQLHIELDYAIAGYRDFKMGQFVFIDQKQALLERGIRKVSTRPGSPAHTRYLERMGFHPEIAENGETIYTLAL